MATDTRSPTPPASVDDRLLLAAIAASPDGVRPTTLERALGASPGSLREETDVFEERGDIVYLGGRLVVQRDEVRDAALERLDHAERANLHGLLADAVGRSSYEPGIAEYERAVHEVRAGRVEEAVARLERVARSALRCADAGLAVRALDERASIESAPVPAAVVALHARAAVEAGDPRAADLLRAAADALEADGAHAHAARATMEWFWSTTTDPEARVALDELAESTHADVVGWSNYAAAVQAIMRGAWTDAIAPLEDALAAARDGDDAALELAVLGSLATARSYLGQLVVAADLLRRCVPLAWSIGDAVSARRVRHNLTEVLVESLRTGDALDEAARGAGDAGLRGAAAFLPGQLALHARMLGLSGRTLEARAEAEHAIALDRALEPHQHDVFVDLVAADLLALEGRTPRFDRFVTALEQRVDEFGYDSYRQAIVEVRFRAAAISGDVESALAAVPPAGELEPVTAACLAAAASRLACEVPQHAGIRTIVDELAAAVSEPARSTVPLAELCLREVEAAAAGNAGALIDIAALWEEAERPVDALLVRRAALRMPGTAGEPSIIERARVEAALEAAGLEAIVRRDRGDRDEQEPQHGDGLAGAPARLHPGDATLLQQLPPAERALVLGALVEHVLEPGESSPLPRGVCIVGSGEVRVLRIEPETTERQLVVAALGPGDAFGHESLLPAGSDAAPRLRIEAASTSEIWVLPAAELAAVMADAPRFGARLLADATSRLAEARMLAGESALLPVETRLARTLVRLGERFGRPSLRGDLLLDTTLTHADIANMIGSQRARVSGLMSGLQKQGVLDSWKRRILVLDLAELSRRSAVEQPVSGE